MTTVANAVSVAPRFRRSANVERDRGDAAALDGYLPTGRALDVIRRVARAAATPDAQRSFSVIGPYGSGKSSMAVFLDALFGPAASSRHRAALDLLADHDPSTVPTVGEARAGLGGNGAGFVPAIVVADREPVTATVWRALAQGVDRFGSGSGKVRRQVRDEIAAKAAAASDPKRNTPPASDLHAAIKRVAERAPVLLVIDEFGKNLEEFATSTRDGDLYLLQQLAEWSHGSDALPLLIVTIQHLAFDQYVSDATSAQRREWAKVQGRFEEVSFHDSPATTRALVRAAVTQDDVARRVHIESAATEQAAAMRAVGVDDLSDPDKAASSYPLHPTTLAVLPDLCSRYGQNERTLFSFVGSAEPASVRSLISSWDLSDTPWVRPHHVYDYFVEASGTLASASSAASRWIEVESRIRDAHNVTAAQRRVLKTVGVLNLVSTGGPVRASTAMLTAACADGMVGTQDAAAVQERLNELADSSVLIFRDFADEWRLWEGSDFNVSAGVEKARHRTERRRLADVVTAVRPLPAVVAARHSYERRTVRAFAYAYVDGGTVSPPPPNSEVDGLVCVTLGAAPEVGPGEKPVLVVIPTDENRSALRRAAVETAAIREVIDESGDDLDRVARRELVERLYQAQVSLDAAAADLPKEAAWHWANPPRSVATVTAAKAALEKVDDGTEHLSAVFDAAYPRDYAVVIHNEMLNRHELTSQGARALRLVLNAMVTSPTAPALGLKPGSAEHSVYAGSLLAAGVHEAVGAPGDGLCQPDDGTSWKVAYGTVTAALAASAKSNDRITAAALLDSLQGPPHGMRAGAASLLLVHYLLTNTQDVAVFEHGTFVPALDEAAVERLVKNPVNFSLRYVDASSAGSRTGKLVRALANSLGVSGPAGSIVPVAARLVRAVAAEHSGVARPYLHRTKAFHSLWDPSVDADDPSVTDAVAVRDALVAATDPIHLVLNDLPAALGYEPIVAGSNKGLDDAEVEEAVRRITAAVAVLERASVRLAEHILDEVLTHTATVDRQDLEAAGNDLFGNGTSAEVERLAAGAAREGTPMPQYGQVLGQMVHPSSTPVSVWVDEDVTRFGTAIRRLGPEFRRDLAMARTKGGTAKLVQVSNGNGPAAIAVVDVEPATMTAATDAITSAMSHLATTLGVSSDDPTVRDAAIAALCALVADGDQNQRTGAHL